MELIVIGSGTGVPSLRRGSPCLALKAAGRLLVLDLGAGSLRSLLRYGLDFSAIDVLALTHLHPDHVGDLIPFLFATRYSLGYTRAGTLPPFGRPGFCPVSPTAHGSLCRVGGAASGPYGPQGTGPGRPG